MINVSDMIAARDRVRNGSASDASKSDLEATGAPDGSSSLARQDAKREAELTLNNGRYYLTKIKK